MFVYHKQILGISNNLLSSISHTIMMTMGHNEVNISLVAHNGRNGLAI